MLPLIESDGSKVVALKCWRKTPIAKEAVLKGKEVIQSSRKPWKKIIFYFTNFKFSISKHLYFFISFKMQEWRSWKLHTPSISAVSLQDFLHLLSFNILTESSNGFFPTANLQICGVSLSDEVQQHQRYGKFRIIYNSEFLKNKLNVLE